MATSCSAAAKLPGSHIKIAEVLTNETYVPAKSDYLKVRLLWKSDTPIFPAHVRGRGFSTKSRVYHFIFADNDNHIMAYLFHKNESKTENVYNKLQQDAVVMIKNFAVRKGPTPCRYFLRGQSTVINLSDNSRDIITCSKEEESMSSALRHLPFDITRFENIDSVSPGSRIDMIGFVNDVIDEKSVDFKSSRYNVTCTSKEVSFPRGCKQHVPEKNVYALLNVEIEDESDGHKKLRVVDGVISLKITQENKHLIPTKYHDLVDKLLPSPRKKSKTPRSPDIDVKVYKRGRIEVDEELNIWKHRKLQRGSDLHKSVMTRLLYFVEC